MTAIQEQMHFVGVVYQIKSNTSQRKYMWQEVQGKANDKGITWQLLCSGPITHSEESKGFKKMSSLDLSFHKCMQPCLHKHTKMLWLRALVFWREAESLSLRGILYITSLKEQLTRCSSAHTYGKDTHKHVDEDEGLCVFIGVILWAKEHRKNRIKKKG